MSWKIRFKPDEVYTMDISVAGNIILHWDKGEGDVTKPVPEPWKNSKSGFIFHAVGFPNGQNATCEYIWVNHFGTEDGYESTFDNGEDFEPATGSIQKY